MFGVHMCTDVADLCIHCTHVCPSGVSFIHLSPRGWSPPRKETQPRPWHHDRRPTATNICISLAKKTQTILWQTYTCMQEWGLCDTPGQLLCVSVCAQLGTPSCSGLRLNAKVPAAYRRMPLSFPAPQLTWSKKRHFLPHWQGNFRHASGHVWSLMLHWSGP